STASPKHTTEPSPSPPGPLAGSASRSNYPPRHRTHEAFSSERTVWGQVLGTGTGFLRAAQGISRKRSTRAPKAHRSTENKAGSRGVTRTRVKGGVCSAFAWVTTCVTGAAVCRERGEAARDLPDGACVPAAP